MKCLNCNAKNSMIKINIGSWIRELMCDRCGTKQNIYYHDLTNGCIVLKTIKWTDINNNIIAEFEYDRLSKLISNRNNILDKVYKQIEEDINMKDFTAIEQLLKNISIEDLIEYLPEEPT